MIIVRVIDGVFAHLWRRAPEWVLSGVTLSWGWILLGPRDVFATSPAFDVFAALASESAWGMTFVALGTLRLAMLAVNGTFRAFPWSPHCRALGSFLNCFLWFAVTASLYASGQAVTGLAVYPGILLLEIVNVIVAASEAGEVGRQRRNGYPD